ncbi:hypothetical protein LY01_01644 [Nonlabens xylanidelens]|uniref:YhhN-like protein n=1 Tax=Nonlabens xylanidelens TaxID=191564 RepID=A0A2S6IL43_9FLAO|nr:hypothetical protein LY01_01644 [Nonlabens xylanidelens]PQJ17439.1 hypothetical protein BST94_10290 [Nonlabens xylanidelens]
MFNIITLVTIIVVATFVVATIFYRSNSTYKILYGILVVNLISEMALLLGKTIFTFPIVHVYNLHIFFHTGLWIYLIVYLLKKFKIDLIIVYSYIMFSLINILFIETKQITFNTFLIGSGIYLLYFIFKNFQLLKLEDLNHFKSNNFLLLSAPLSFFFAMSFVFSFRDSEMRMIKIGGRTLYNILQNGGNIIYYSLLILYIIKSRNDGKTQIAND